MTWLFIVEILCFLGTVYGCLNAPPSPCCLLWGQPYSKRDDYTYTRGIGAHKVHTKAVLWYEARLICQSEGGHLAIMNSIEEANLVAKMFTNAEPATETPHPDFASVGFHDLYKEGEYITIHDQSIAKAGYDRWVPSPGPGQSDNGGTRENCGSIHKSAVLNDISCTVKFAFICELAICGSDCNARY